MKEFDEGIYKLQKLDYDVGFEWPKPLRVKNTLYARIKFPDSLEVERGSRHDKLSAKIKGGGRLTCAFWRLYGSL